MQDEWKFLELFGEIDDEIIYQAGEPWKRGKSSVNHLKAAGIILAILLGLSGIFHTEVRAGIENIISQIQNILGIKDDISSYTETLHRTITKNGLSITLEEAALDQSELIVSYLVEPKADTDENFAFNSKAWINGKEVTSSEFHCPENELGSTTYHLIECYRFDENFFTDGTVSIKLAVNPQREDGSVIGEFKYSFESSYEKIKAETVELSLDQNIHINQDTLNLNHFTLNGLESTITGTWDNYQEDWDYYLKGADSLGNIVRYRQNYVSNTGFDFVLDKSEGYLSPRAEWVELQVYVHEAQLEAISKTDAGEVMEESYYDASDFEDMYPVGEKFKIQIKGK